MPPWLVVVLGMLVLALVASGLSSDWLSFAIHVGLLLGLLRGHEGARGALIFLGGAGVFLYLAGFGVTLLFLFQASGQVVAETDPAALFVSASGLLTNALTLYALHRSDVQEWMFERSLRGGAEPPP